MVSRPYLVRGRNMSVVIPAKAGISLPFHGSEGARVEEKRDPGFRRDDREPVQTR